MLKVFKTGLILGLLSFLTTSFGAERKPLDKKTQQSVIKALEVNEELHAAFFDYDAKQVEAKADALSKAIKQIENPDIAKSLEFSQKKLQAIKADQPRDTNNQNYHLVSMALIHLINTYDLGEKYKAYSCPMVKMKWVQNTEKMSKVHNPYAPNMPHCGARQ